MAAQVRQDELLARVVVCEQIGEVLVQQVAEQFVARARASVVYKKTSRW